MGSLSNYSEDELMDHVFNAAYTAPANVYLALCTADPGETGTGASMSEKTNAQGYARTAITFGAAAARRVTQNADVTFPTASGTYPAAITHYAIVDSATHGAGNLLASGAFSSSFTPVSGNTPIVASGQVYVEIGASSGAGFSNYLVHKWLDLMFRNQAFTKPATHLALSTTVLDDADVAFGDFTEVTGTGYARLQINVNGGASPTWTLSSGGAISNTHLAAFPTVGAGGWSQLVAVAIMDSGTVGAGNVLGFDSANIVDQTPAQNDIVRFPVGDFDMALS